MCPPHEPAPEPAVEPAVEPASLPDAHAWTDALRRGTTATWSQWCRDRDGAGGADGAGSTDLPALPYLPGAQHLELVRRINAAARAEGRAVPAGLADRVLTAGIPDRGLPDLPLAGLPPRGSGPAPVVPETLPYGDLLAVAAGVIGDALAAVAADPPTHAAVGSRSGNVAGDGVLTRLGLRGAPWRYTGDPWARTHLDPGWLGGAGPAPRPGRRPGVRRRRTAVLAGDLTTLAVHAWAARSFDGGGHSLTGWLRHRVTADRLPPVLDVAATARHVADRYGPVQTVVVLDPAARPGSAPVPPVRPWLVEAVRQVGRGLGTQVPPAQRHRLLRDLLHPRLALLDTNTPPLDVARLVPEPWAGHLRAHADRVIGELRRAGYPVRGSLDLLRPPEAAGQPPHRPNGRALDLAITLLLEMKDGVW